MYDFGVGIQTVNTYELKEVDVNFFLKIRSNLNKLNCLPLHSVIDINVGLSGAYICVSADAL
jgi:hypothetical protein